jgi:hypothetical protein
MKILREIKQIDMYCRNEMDAASRVLFEAQMLLDPALRIRVQYQQKLYRVIKRSGRRQIKSEAERVHRVLFSDPSKAEFCRDIFKLFPKT